jgi:hypothetical protein
MLTFCKAIALTLHLASVHTDATQNNFNPGIGAQCAVTEYLSVGTGAYYNSQRRASVYANATLTAPIGYGARAGVTVGAATGYDYGPVAPVAGAVIQSPPVNGWTAGVFIGPRTRNNAGVAHLTLSKGF